MDLIQMFLNKSITWAVNAKKKQIQLWYNLRLDLGVKSNEDKK
jgi:hypothetical protein